MTVRTTPARTRALVVLTTALALLATLLGGAPASAAGATTITGRVTYPSAITDPGPAYVVVFSPDDRYIEHAAQASVAPDGTFTVSGLDAGEGYQVMLTDVSGQTATGYYAKGATRLAVGVSGATLVKPGATLALKPRVAVTTSVVLTLPENTFPSWSPRGAYLVEAATGRPFAAESRFGGAAAVTTIPLTFGGLAAEGRYTLFLATDEDQATGYYYGGAGRAMVRARAKAALVPAGAKNLKVLVMGVVNKTVPTVTGKAKVGAKLTATPGTWAVAGTPSYRWLRNGVAISGATGKTYVPVAADLGKKLKVQVTFKATTPGYAPGVATSTATAAVTR
ncbi:hypothetical protein [Cellulomonas sp.]|uniref:hypothetical protein n=1 Tax=Cellulomonas sp. TaxID=40001 RepID=UPI002587DEEF|nr:hypothetical protein [Cellulomonas sp.]MCR6688305.1 hypothetical protein [Cellulomonas sp.]